MHLVIVSGANIFAALLDTRTKHFEELHLPHIFFFYKKHSIKKITSQIQQKQVKQVDKKSTNTTRKKQINKELTDNQTATNPNTQDQYITAFQPKPKHPF